MTADTNKQIANLLQQGPCVLNVGVHAFAETLAHVGAPHLHVDWQPPAQGDPELASALAALADDTAPGSIGARIVAANAEALRRIFAADRSGRTCDPRGRSGRRWMAVCCFTRVRQLCGSACAGR